MPMTTPIRTVWPSSQVGHQRVGTACLLPPAGAATAIATAVSATTTDQRASAQRQSPCANGRAPAGLVRAVGRVSPINMPLLNTAVASAIRRGNQSRTREGKAGWLTATPTPITKVAENIIGTLGPSPRAAPKTAT